MNVASLTEFDASESEQRKQGRENGSESELSVRWKLSKPQLQEMIRFFT